MTERGGGIIPLLYHASTPIKIRENIEKDLMHEYTVSYESNYM